MHALRNYFQTEPIYDGNAYSFSSTYLDGQFKLYAHYLTAPTRPGQRPDYHTTQLDAYALTGRDEVRLEGTGAFRSLRVLAKRYRDAFIETANARARKYMAVAEAEAEAHVGLARTTDEQQEGGSSPADFFDCELFAEPEDGGVSQDANVGLTIFHHGYNENHSQEPFDTEVPTKSFASRFTSAVSGGPLAPFDSEPKLPHSPPSPSSVRRQKKR